MVLFVTSKKRIMTYFSFFVLGSIIAIGIKGFNKRAIATNLDVNNSASSFVAIIIDDFGNNSEGTKEMLSLPIKFTGAVMPNMSSTSQDAESLFQNGKEVILHIPMEAHTGKRSWLGQNPIMNDYSPEKADEIFLESLRQIPHCVGVNNHMGSKVTENKEIMTAIFKSIKNENLIFIDSMTSGKSVTSEVAKAEGVSIIKRDVFLDSTDDIAKVKDNLKKTTEIAKKKGYAVAIGHVGAEGGNVTYKAINDMYKQMEEQGIKFIGISELNKMKNI